MDWTDLQQTIAKTVTYTGIGLHTGEDVKMTCLPAPEDTGICFRRVDLPQKPMIKVSPMNIVSTKRCTSIGSIEENWYIHTIEHLMAAISMTGIDNLIVELDAGEPPVTDGSAVVFMDLFKEAGLIKQSKKRRVIKITEPIFVRDNDATLVALPYDGLRISYTLSYNHPVIGTQYVDYEINSEVFLKEIAPARTFGFCPGG
ncbi:UDP-3-O-acyl-N-acetylglucosamine deacetylase [Anoxybacter fermentans]|uniref:UDP-3-O-acyl-N-acetylglucosamine deacetylase n=1 Tax=Anoxybacter fermentans TaxID=1323375 RepID=UPI0026B65E10